MLQLFILHLCLIAGLCLIHQCFSVVVVSPFRIDEVLVVKLFEIFLFVCSACKYKVIAALIHAPS